MGEEVLAADFNTFVQDQVVATFPNAAARSTALPSPKIGQLSYLTDVKRLEEYTDKSGTPGWYRPWGTPWGNITYGTFPEITLNTGDQWVSTGININFPGRLIKCTFTGHLLKDGNASHVEFRVQKGAEYFMPAMYWIPAGGKGRLDVFEVFNGENTVVGLIGKSEVGTAVVQWGRAHFEDLGPIP